MPPLSSSDHTARLFSSHGSIPATSLGAVPMLEMDVPPGEHLPGALTGASGPRRCPLTEGQTPTAKDTTQSRRASTVLAENLWIFHSDKQKEESLVKDIVSKNQRYHFSLNRHIHNCSCEIAKRVRGAKCCQRGRHRALEAAGHLPALFSGSLDYNCRAISVIQLEFPQEVRCLKCTNIYSYKPYIQSQCDSHFNSICSYLLGISKHETHMNSLILSGFPFSLKWVTERKKFSTMQHYADSFRLLDSPPTRRKKKGRKKSPSRSAAKIFTRLADNMIWRKPPNYGVQPWVTTSYLKTIWTLVHWNISRTLAMSRVVGRCSLPAAV